MFGNKPGQRIIELAETDSTNSYAARLLHDEIPEEGTLIYTRFQKAGRGQRGTTWESEHGKNLLLSYIFYPTFLQISNQFLFNQAIAIALRETL
ncbi:MAG: biotin--[acetyl-CoA-carboxylase] ligase, partial [Bacteroidota bacterium]|nr:biotin--[acetyl-CoA-carboxylase] ligase [Bacteroidota bacterium]